MKTKFDKDQLDLIVKLHNDGLGARKTAVILGVSREAIRKAYAYLNLDLSGKNKIRTVYKATEKKCKICSETKEISNFRKRQRGDRVSFEVYCIPCEKEYSKVSNKKRYDADKAWHQDYRQKNLEKITLYNKNYRQENKDILQEKANLKAKNKRKTDPCFKIRERISISINAALKSQNCVKLGSCLKFLPYTMQELKQYIESQFEPWMNWENWGLYKASEWDDNDSSTWKWQIDHIVPHSTFKYTSMDQDSFKECWKLENLRPYSAKQNILDGVKKTRHKI